MWQSLSKLEKNSVAVQIDLQDPFNKYGANAGAIAKADLPFYQGAELLRVTNQSPAVGNRYFILHDQELVPLHALDGIQSFCDNHFGVSLDSSTVADYFRFAHFFSDMGQNTSLVETPHDLRIDPSSASPEKQKAIAFIKPPEIKGEEGGVTVTACTYDERPSRLFRDSYRLTPGQPLQLLKREDSGINLGNAFLDKQLKIGRTDTRPFDARPGGQPAPELRM